MILPRFLPANVAISHLAWGFANSHFQIGFFANIRALCETNKYFGRMATSVVESPIKEKIDTNGYSSPTRDCKSVEEQLKSFPKRKLDDISLDETSSVINKIPRTSRSRPFTVSIEGNIGSGKSTFLKVFAGMKNVETHEEPLNLWTNASGHNLLKMLYEDSNRWNFLFNSYVQLTRLNIHLNDSESVDNIKIIERSLMNNRHCFLECSHNSGDLNDAEFHVLKAYYEFLEKHLDIGLDLIVYLKTSPEVVFERMRKRNRAEESTVSLKYLRALHQYYEDWLNEKTHKLGVELIVIDADKDLQSVLQQIELNKDKILGCVSK